MDMNLRDRLMSVTDVTGEIVSLTSPGRQSFSLLPADLNSTNLVLAGVIELLEESLESGEDTSDLLALLIVRTYCIAASCSTSVHLRPSWLSLSNTHRCHDSVRFIVLFH